MTNKNFFTGIETLEQLKKEYRKLAKKHHPDLNKKDTTEIMKAINVQYDALFEQLKKGDTHSENENVHTFKNIVNELIKYENITIDIVGSWLWIYGNGTFKIKDTLKNYGFRWSKNKKKWYFFEGIEKTKKVRGKKTYQQIVNTYGKQTIATKKDPNKLLLN